MGENTKIEWAHHTFNPWYGCQKVGPGCDHCYAEGWAKRSGLVQWGPGTERRRSSPANWRKPLVWNAEAERLGVRYRVFCASLADVFDNAVPTAWRMDLFSLIAKTPHLDWLLVTKRVGNVLPMCSGDGLMFDMLWQRVWLGITVCNQAEADRDIPKLLQVPAKVRWLSMEPLLGPVVIPGVFLKRLDWGEGQKEWPDGAGVIDWIVCGGESGPKARPIHGDWARSLRDQCAAAGVPFLFKQWGEWLPAGQDGNPEHDPFEINASDSPVRIGKAAAGRLLDGSLHDGYPEPRS
ncbi:MAG: phage Gp37/Gp68 family protein [Phenylobacterium sp.]|nr:phage Gp37/Gp68 family protein [Phenylobacterium sp.]